MIELDSEGKYEIFELEGDSLRNAGFKSAAELSGEGKCISCGHEAKPTYSVPGTDLTPEQAEWIASYCDPVETDDLIREAKIRYQQTLGE